MSHKRIKIRIKRLYEEPEKVITVEFL